MQRAAYGPRVTGCPCLIYNKACSKVLVNLLTELSLGLSSDEIINLEKVESGVVEQLFLQVGIVYHYSVKDQHMG